MFKEFTLEYLKLEGQPNLPQALPGLWEETARGRFLLSSKRVGP